MALLVPCTRRSQPTSWQAFTTLTANARLPASTLSSTKVNISAATEFGWFPHPDEKNEGLYHITLWHIDARQSAGRPSDRGVAATFEQPLGCEGKLVPFLRYAYAHRGLNGIRQNLSIGLGVEDVFGRNEDVIGVAWSWEESSNQTLRNQNVFETFYRLYITPHTHLSPDIQVVIDPANAPNKDAVTIFGLRLRTLY